MKVVLLLSLIGVSAGFVLQPSVTMPSSALNYRKEKVEEQSFVEMKKPASTPSIASPNALPVSQQKKMKDMVVPPDYWMTWTMLFLAPAIMLYHPSYYEDGSMSLIALAGASFHLIFGRFLWVQTDRVRCVFEKDSFEFYNLKDGELTQKPSNYVADTANRWKYDTIVNYGFFPSEDFPVICYFKETETPEWKWDRWFAAFDSYGNGQPHFFPGIVHVKTFKEQMELRGVKSKPIPTLMDAKKE